MTLSLQAFVRLFSLVKVPLLGLVRPTVVELTRTRARVRLPLNYLTKNHVGSMYFGALAMGAELSIALRVVDRMRLARIPVTFIFKDFECHFLKRAESDVDFICDQVEDLDALLEEALTSRQRVEKTLSGRAVPKEKHNAEDALMNYRLTISVKVRESSRS